MVEMKNVKVGMILEKTKGVGQGFARVVRSDGKFRAVLEFEYPSDCHRHSCGGLVESGCGWYLNFCEAEYFNYTNLDKFPREVTI